ncbi:MAG: hypothetical protein ACSLFN_15680 [Candidatus Limnocylindrales bacterium]
MRRLIGAMAGAVMIAIISTGMTFANHAISGDNVAPNANAHTYIAGNPKCGAAPDGGFNLKIEAEDLGVGTYGPIEITSYDGKYVSWKIAAGFTNVYDANTVIVKGGPNAIIYAYDVWDDADTRLTSPRNYNGAQPKYYGISHVDFCFDPKA